MLYIKSEEDLTNTCLMRRQTGTDLILTGSARGLILTANEIS